MKYIEQYNHLTDLFDLTRDEISLPGSRTIIRNMTFHSKMPWHFNFPGINEDNKICENSNFRYPVILPEGKAKFSEAIIFLHGLNERTWNKHLAGARFLAEKTNKAVIMFPLSYHINRGLPEWSDTRKMSALLELRKQKYPNVKDASVVNLALSERLTDFPERFFISGLQSGMDLIALLKEIRTGDHPLFEQGTKIDLFAYSISCMMLQSLMISNPDNILENSRIVFFAGGSLFSHLQGISKYILDSVAFESIHTFYSNIIRRKTSLSKGVFPWIMENKFGQSFRAIIAPDKLRNVREKSMDNFHDNLMVIALRDDKVIPVEGIRMATGDKFFHSKKFRIVHFPYAYTHENPFPVLYRKIDELVEKAFLSVFNPTLEFLATS
jgi:hypothetical protein